MAIQFDFNQLRDIYLQALKSHDKTLIFETHIGKGNFLFMMFLSDEDVESKDKLFIYLRNTSHILSVKMYGSHRLGKFEVYIDENTKNRLIEELQLSSTSSKFDFFYFLNQLNKSIPMLMPLDDKIRRLRDNRDIIKTLNVVSESDRTVLIGVVKLPSHKKPQDKTLRKLYMYTEGSVQEITKFIELLKKVNMTVSWTSKDKISLTPSIGRLLASLNYIS